MKTHCQLITALRRRPASAFILLLLITITSNNVSYTQLPSGLILSGKAGHTEQFKPKLVFSTSGGSEVTITTFSDEGKLLWSTLQERIAGTQGINQLHA